MKVVLVVKDGPSRKGTEKLLRLKQKLRIGRTKDSDWDFELDDRMSRRHFEVWTNDVGCYIRDMGSRNGTQVNGKPIVEQLLQDGDEIAAGNTRFQVRVEGGDLEKARETLTTKATYSDEPAVAHALRGELKVDCSMESCESGWTLFRAKVEDVSPAVICQLLTVEIPTLCLVIDFHRLGQPRPAEFPGEYLFNWLPDAVAEAMSPWVVESKQLPLDVWKPLVNDGWGSDCVLGVLSELPADELLTHLRDVSRVKSPGAAEGVSGLCWPSILSTSLMSSRSELIKKLVEKLKAVVVELPDLPETWQLFGPPDLEKALAAFGFKIARPEGDAPASS